MREKRKREKRERSEINPPKFFYLFFFQGTLSGPSKHSRETRWRAGSWRMANGFIAPWRKWGTPRTNGRWAFDNLVLCCVWHEKMSKKEREREKEKEKKEREGFCFFQVSRRPPMNSSIS